MSRFPSPSKTRPFLDETQHLDDQSRRWTDAVTGLQDIESAGSPETVQTGKRGRRYLDTENTRDGADLWIKRVDEVDGDSTKGWVLVSSLGGTGDKIVNVATDYTVLPGNEIIFTDGILTITLPDPETTSDSVSIRNISGTTTVLSAAGTVEDTVLTTSQGATYGPRASGWFSLP